MGKSKSTAKQTSTPKVQAKRERDRTKRNGPQLALVEGGADKGRSEIAEALEAQERAAEVERKAQLATWTDLAGILSSPAGADVAFNVPQIVTELRAYVARRPEVMADILPRLRSLYFAVVKDAEGATQRDEHGLDRPTDEAFAFRDALKSAEGIGAQLASRAERRAKVARLEAELAAERAALGEDRIMVGGGGGRKTAARKSSGATRTRSSGGAVSDVAKQIASYVGDHPGEGRAAILAALGITEGQWSGASRAAKDAGLIKMTGDRRSGLYWPAGHGA